MTKNALPLSVFLAGLAAICWIGAGYAGSSPLGLLVTGVIGACYLAGAHELHRYRQASASLRAAVAASGEAQTGLADWLQRVDPGLRNAVRDGLIRTLRQNVDPEKAARDAKAEADIVIQEYTDRVGA